MMPDGSAGFSICSWTLHQKFQVTPHKLKTTLLSCNELWMQYLCARPGLLHTTRLHTRTLITYSSFSHLYLSFSISSTMNIISFESLKNFPIFYYILVRWAEDSLVKSTKWRRISHSQGSSQGSPAHLRVREVWSLWYKAWCNCWLWPQ